MYASSVVPVAQEAGLTCPLIVRHVGALGVLEVVCATARFANNSPQHAVANRIISVCSSEDANSGNDTIGGSPDFGRGRQVIGNVVELGGIEPPTSCMPCKRSPS